MSENHAAAVGEEIVPAIRSADARFSGFAELIGSTHCPYAPRARVRSIPEPYTPGSTSFLPCFRTRQHWLSDPEVDAVVIAIGLEELGADLAGQAKTFRALLQLLSGVQSTAEVHTPGWQLEIAGTRAFATFFSPLYPHENPRAILGGDFGYVMFQPEHSFHKHLPRERLDPGKRSIIKDSIRQAFDRAGKPYDPLDTVPETEAQKYVKPLRIGDPIIAWWSSGANEIETD